MFKTHPNVSNIKFVIVPMVTEGISHVCDVPIDYYDLIDKYGEGQPDACGFKFDFSILQ